MCPVKQGHLPQRPTWQCGATTDILFSLFHVFAPTKVPRIEKRNELSVTRDRSALNFKGLTLPSLFHAQLINTSISELTSNSFKDDYTWTSFLHWSVNILRGLWRGLFGGREALCVELGEWAASMGQRYGPGWGPAVQGHVETRWDGIEIELKGLQGNSSSSFLQVGRLGCRGAKWHI